MAAPVVRLTGVTVSYNGGQPALDAATFALEPGDRVAVVGPNGAGKSTLLKVIAGILHPSEGAVEVYGQGASGHTCISYVPQRSEVDWAFPVTVADVVLMGRVARIGLLRQASRKDRQLVRESLDRVGMGDLAARQIGELSGGQQQRVFIARALAQEAELLLMDEPFTGLDAPSHAAILEILEALRPQNMTVMVSMHDLHLAGERFERILLLNRRVVAFGTPEQVLTGEHLQSAYGGQMTVLETSQGTLAFGDTCCQGRQHD
jgi:manganese/iron transport system ATP-binding protein